MNKARRKQIAQLLEQLENLKADLDSILEEEQEAFDNLPESLQEGERGQASQTAIESLESAQSAFEEVVDALNYIE